MQLQLESGALQDPYGKMKAQEDKNTQQSVHLLALLT